MINHHTPYIVGIDLGTTNSAVAWVETPIGPSPEDESRRHIHLFEIPQITGAQEIAGLPVLPSFLYVPGPYDQWCTTSRLPWENLSSPVLPPRVGAFARDYGAGRPDHLVASAKSWLCHGGVNRRAPILPWGAAPEVPRLSPVQAAAAYLQHIRAAWNAQWPDDETRFLEHQLVVLTVPASFDEVARDLTLEAARLAGLPEVVLLEEPLAAFYSWLMQHEHDWRRFIAPGERVLVCDVGGGTTDLTLIALQEAGGSPRFERLAVGDHLILGGDNMDLALARMVAPHLRPAGVGLTPELWKSLCHQCRQAKEVLLEGQQTARRITLVGRGRRLIADTLQAELTRVAAETMILDGFFPLAPPEPAHTADRKGISELGLPYEPQPAITWHIDRFLRRHAPADSPSVTQGAGEHPLIPELILFNGGALKPRLIQDRIRAALQGWSGRNSGAADSPRVLPNPRPETAVALGAAYYGLVKTGIGVRVGSGSPRAFYLGVDLPNEKSSDDRPHDALCLVERGLDEGAHIALPDQHFEVRANQPVRFTIYSSSFRAGDRCGDRIAIDDTLTPLPPIQTVIQYGQTHAATRLPVTIEAHYTEIGTLALWCRSLISNHRWRLQFSLRDEPESGDVSESVIFEKSLVDAACRHVREVFGEDRRSPRLVQLMKTLADLLEAPRAKWPLGLLRSLADTLIELAPRRRITPEHASRWLNLTGFCLRPGLGEGFDAQRMQALWKIYLQGPLFANAAQVRIEWWVLWRRVAGGLSAGQQKQVFQNAVGALNIGKSSRAAPLNREQIETWMALAAMERLPLKEKITLARTLLARLGSAPQQWWVLGRLGARELLYGPLDRVLPPAEISPWLDIILARDWSDSESVGAALMRLCRKTGDQARDLPPPDIARVLAWMASHSAALDYRQYLTSVIPMARLEAEQVFGEELPAGLVLVG